LVKFVDHDAEIVIIACIL